MLKRSFILYWITAYLLKPLYSIFIKSLIEGEHFLPSKGAVILVSNHISYIDGFSLAYLGVRRKRSVHFLAKDSLFKNRILGSYLKLCGQIPVARQTSNASQSLVAAENFINLEHCVGIYPEATMPENLEQLPIKSGAVRLAMQTSTPIVVVGTWGGHELYRKGHWPRLKLRVKHSMVVTPPYIVDGNLSVEEARDQLAEKMKDATRRAKRKLSN